MSATQTGGGPYRPNDDVYLSDGLYARHDGWYIVLIANKGGVAEKTVYLDPGGWPALKRLAAEVGWEEER